MSTFRRAEPADSKRELFPRRSPGRCITGSQRICPTTPSPYFASGLPSRKPYDPQWPSRKALRTPASSVPFAISADHSATRWAHHSRVCGAGGDPALDPEVSTAFACFSVVSLLVPSAPGVCEEVPACPVSLGLSARSTIAAGLLASFFATLLLCQKVRPDIAVISAAAPVRMPGKEVKNEPFESPESGMTGDSFRPCESAPS